MRHGILGIYGTLIVVSNSLLCNNLPAVRDCAVIKWQGMQEPLTHMFVQAQTGGTRKAVFADNLVAVLIMWRSHQSKNGDYSCYVTSARDLPAAIEITTSTNKLFQELCKWSSFLSTLTSYRLLGRCPDITVSCYFHLLSLPTITISVAMAAIVTATIPVSDVTDKS